MFMQREHLTPTLIIELWPLLREHWATIAHYQDIPLNPDWERYDQVQAADQLRVYTLRTATGYKLVGYAIFIVNTNAHYRTSLQAVQDVLYLDPSARQGWAALKFLKWCDAQLQADGVQAVYHHSKAQHDFGIILERMGYAQVDIIYARRLDHGGDSGNHHGRGHTAQLRHRSDERNQAGQGEHGDAPAAGPGPGRAEAGDRGAPRRRTDSGRPGSTESGSESAAATLGRGEGTVLWDAQRHVADRLARPGVEDAAGRLT